jgi:hypothetical protein
MTIMEKMITLKLENSGYSGLMGAF